jgi:hypothetical protein
MIQMLYFGFHLTRDDPAGGDDFGWQRLFQLPSEIPGLPRQKLASRHPSLRLRRFHRCEIGEDAVAHGFLNQAGVAEVSGELFGGCDL